MDNPFSDIPPLNRPGEVPPRVLAVWDGGRAILFFVFAAVSTLLLGVALFEPLGFYGSVVVAEIIGFAVTPWLLSRVFATGWAEWTASVRLDAAFWGWTLAVVVGYAVVQSNLPVFFDRLYPMPTEQFEMYRRYLSADSAGEFLLFILVAAIVPAFSEEIAFRGMIQSGLKRTFGRRHAIVWTGFLFALLHMNLWNFISLWAFGCLLGYLTERTGSIRPAILVHLLNNALALAVFSGQTREDWDQPLEFVAWYWTVLAGILLIGALVRLHRLPVGDAVNPDDRPPFSSA